MKREFSAGGIVFNKEGQVLVTQHSTNKYWGFPKGIIDPGQTSKEAAVREVKEEGGVEAEIIAKVGDSKYTYNLSKTKISSSAYTFKPGNKVHNLESPIKGEKIFKIVTLYLMRYISGNSADHDWEVSDSGWFTPAEALEKLSFSNDKNLLKKALEMINK